MITGVVSGRGVAKSGQTLLARIVNVSGTNITQATISTITYKVRDVDAGTSGTETSLTVASVVFDTLQTSSAWDVDSTGYNFAATIPATEFSWTPTLDANNKPVTKLFQVDVEFTPSSGQPFVVPWLLTIWPVWT